MMNELREFIEKMDAIAAEQPIVEQSDDMEYTLDLVDQLEEALSQAVDIARQLESTRELGNVVGGYTRPWLEAFLSSNTQTGSITDLRGRLEDEDEEDDYQ